MIEGGVVSLTVTVNVHSALDVPAVAVHVTIVSPTGNALPDAGTQPTVAPAQDVGVV